MWTDFATYPHCRSWLFGKVNQFKAFSNLVKIKIWNIFDYYYRTISQTLNKPRFKLTYDLRNMRIFQLFTISF